MTHSCPPFLQVVAVEHPLAVDPAVGLAVEPEPEPEPEVEVEVVPASTPPPLDRWGHGRRA